ncbi:hypothetical protein F5B18DRAFT_668562 [Nemania serpens]|nr:hypothetical protein F5B18DRAFT_668562 [Nemania serpens]
MAPDQGKALPASLCRLPLELVRKITKDMGFSDKFQLMRTCWDMYRLVRDDMYNDDFNSPNPRALHWACAHGFLSIIEEILDKGIAVDHVFTYATATEDYQPNRSLTPLTTAVGFRQLEAVRLLLQRGADANFTAHKPESKAESEFEGTRLFHYSRRGASPYATPLQWATIPFLHLIRGSWCDIEKLNRHNQLTEDIVRTLLTHHADVNMVSSADVHTLFTPLMRAVMNEDVPSSVVRILQDAGAAFTAPADPSLPHHYALDPFHLFVEAVFGPWRNDGHTAMTPNSRYDFLTPLDKEKLELVLSGAKDSDLLHNKACFTRLLMSSPTPKMLECTRIFLRYFGKGEDDEFPRVAAAVHAFSKVFNGPYDENILVDLCDGYKKLFSMLIEFELPLDFTEPSPRKTRRDTALTALCGSRCPDEVPIEDFVNLFLSNGASPTARDSQGYSAMHYASRNVNIRAATALLAAAPLSEFLVPETKQLKEPKLNLLGYLSGAPAAGLKGPESYLTDFLFEVCAAVVVKDGARAAFADLLIKSGIGDVNVTYCCSHSPLLLACVQGDASLVRLLLKHGADPNLDSAPHTPLRVVTGLYSEPYKRAKRNTIRWKKHPQGKSWTHTNLRRKMLPR